MSINIGGTNGDSSVSGSSLDWNTAAVDENTKRFTPARTAFSMRLSELVKLFWKNARIFHAITASINAAKCMTASNFSRVRVSIKAWLSDKSLEQGRIAGTARL